MDQRSIKELFEFVKINKAKGHSLKFSLEKYAASQGSTLTKVKNSYYQCIDELKAKPKLAKRLGINVEDFVYAEYEYFNDEEIKSLLIYILTNGAKNKSVRRCVFELANGEKNQALRLLNKYRSVLSRKEKLVYDVMMNLYEKSISFVNPYNSKLVVPQFNLLKSIGINFDINNLSDLSKLIKHITTSDDVSLKTSPRS